ncbi:MAG: hypothetical protein ACHQX4_09725 [Gemmatimonadales bacterium]
MLAVAGLIAAPSLAQAQAHAAMAMGASPEHEFGVDVAVGFQSFSNAGVSTSGLFANTPVDLRVGFMSHSKMNLEMRTSLALSTTGTTTYNFDPGLNVLFKMGQGTMQNNTYWTVGADASIINNGAATNGTGVAPAINGGIGIRRPWGSAAWRLEGGLRYVFKNTNVFPANELQVGVRAGISLWH